MQLTVEISMYPFNEDYKTLIKDFIAELNSKHDIQVVTSATSTMVHGEYDHVIDVLRDLMAWSYENHGRSVFVAKFIPGHELNG